jgi:predicted acetyltransferase
LEIEVTRVDEEDRSVLANLLQLYRYDFSERRGYDLTDHGTFVYRYLDHYFVEVNRYAWFIRCDSHLAGFAMVRSHLGVSELSEFFVLRRYRRRGIGKTAAFEVLSMFPGKWTLSVDKDNNEAKLFWESVIGIIDFEGVQEISRNPDRPNQTCIHFEVSA